MWFQLLQDKYHFTWRFNSVQRTFKLFRYFSSIFEENHFAFIFFFLIFFLLNLVRFLQHLTQRLWNHRIIKRFWILVIFQNNIRFIQAFMKVLAIATRMINPMNQTRYNRLFIPQWGQCMKIHHQTSICGLRVPLRC